MRIVRFAMALRPTRRSFQFTLRSVLCVIALTALICGWPHFRRYHAIWQLRHYVGVDLRKLADDEMLEVVDWIKIIVGSHNDPPSSTLWMYQEYYLVHVSSTPDTNGRLYVVQMLSTMSHPGWSACQLDVADPWGRWVRTIRFNVGTDAFPMSARFDESRYGTLMLVVETSNEEAILGESRQFYRVTDGLAEFLRSEQLDGTLPEWGCGVFEIEEKPHDWGSWKQLLAADQQIDQLRGLATFWSYDVQHRLWSGDIRSVDDKTRKRLEELSTSDDPWIREEAAAAVRWLAQLQPDAAATKDTPELQRTVLRRGVPDRPRLMHVSLVE